jgi:hypothetical protein
VSDPDGFTIGGPIAAVRWKAPEWHRDGARVPVEIVGENLTASVALELESWGGGPQTLIDYFADLAAHWRGWAGEKAWDDDGGNLTIEAIHDGIGTTMLHVTGKRSYAPLADSWVVRVYVAVEPGALTTIAANVARLLTPPGHPTGTS